MPTLKVIEAEYAVFKLGNEGGEFHTLSAIFFAKKWRTKTQVFSSLCEAQLHSKGAAFSSHLHKKREALLVKTRHFIPLVKRSACAAREVFSLRE